MILNKYLEFDENVPTWDTVIHRIRQHAKQWVIRRWPVIYSHLIIRSKCMWSNTKTQAGDDEESSNYVALEMRIKTHLNEGERWILIFSSNDTCFISSFGYCEYIDTHHMASWLRQSRYEKSRLKDIPEKSFLALFLIFAILYASLSSLFCSHENFDCILNYFNHPEPIAPHLCQCMRRHSQSDCVLRYSELCRMCSSGHCTPSDASVVFQRIVYRHRQYILHGYSRFE